MLSCLANLPCFILEPRLSVLHRSRIFKRLPLHVDELPLYNKEPRFFICKTLFTIKLFSNTSVYTFLSLFISLQQCYGI